MGTWGVFLQVTLQVTGAISLLVSIAFGLTPIVLDALDKDARRERPPA